MGLQALMCEDSLTGVAKAVTFSSSKVNPVS